MARLSLIAAVALSTVAAACGSSVEDVRDVLASRPTPSLPTSPSPSPGSTDEPTGAGKPPIVVRTPVAGDEIASPVTVAGTADVFEATVSIRIVDGTGGELASTFTTATCGSGCRGAYSTDVFFFIDQRQNGTIEVFESSAEDGSRLHLVSIPVVLVPGR